MKVSDNVSTIKTFYDKKNDRRVSVFGTYNGNINFVYF